MNESESNPETPLILLQESHCLVIPAALVAIKLVDLWSDGIVILMEQNENSDRFTDLPEQNIHWLLPNYVIQRDVRGTDLSREFYFIK